MKKIFLILTLISLAACETLAEKEANKTLKQRSASDRINSTNSNSDNLFKDIDE